jgi:hypothetical protein
MLEKYLDTFERIPDEIVLSLLTRDLNLDEPTQCVCGWVVRENLALAAGKDADEIDVDGENMPELCQKAFGGSQQEWYDIYYDVTDPERIPVIERALMIRVLEATQ